MPRGIYPRRVKRHAVTQPLDPSYRLIPLTQGQNAIVDAADYDWLSQWPWHVHKGYATRTLNGWSKVQMAREIIGCSPKKQVDHKNHQTLDNRRKNLRECTRVQNDRNRSRRTTTASGFKGLSWHRPTGKWGVQIKVGKKHISLGYFYDAKEAARAYDKGAKKYFGEFASLNF